jgi:hypothetical protein
MTAKSKHSGKSEQVHARHSSEGWNPVLPLIYKEEIKNWTPAFAGVTTCSEVS